MEIIVKECKLLLLPEKEGVLCKNHNNNRLWEAQYGGIENYTNASINHLYVLSNDKIEKDDWIIDSSSKGYHYEQVKDLSVLSKNTSSYKKIIATTNEFLYRYENINEKLTRNDSEKTSIRRLPKIPRSFIKHYILEKGNIEELHVEYVVSDKKCVNLNDNNEIIIYPVKSIFLKEEVIKLFHKFREDCLDEELLNLTTTFTSEWLNKNL